jgi:xylulokinase
MADVLGAPVCKNVDYDPKTKTWGDANWNACSVGMAYKAKWGWERHAARGERKVISFDDVVRECRMRRAKVRGNVCGQVNMDEEGIRVVAAPGEGAGAYEKSAEWWKALERKALERRTLEDK